LKIGIATRNPEAYSSAQLLEAMKRRAIPCVCFSFPQIVARVTQKPSVKCGKLVISKDLDGLIIRPIGKGSLEELVFRMDVLYRLQRSGLYLLNPPEAIEHCVDKYDILALLEENGIAVPRTAVTENTEEALEAFDELGEDVVVKPIFGSRGVGATRINDREVASTVFSAIRFYHGVIYLQEFVSHGFSDIRALVVGNHVVAAMRRVARNWKTNYSQGARPEAIKIDKSLEKIAVHAAGLVECKVAGVDILESPSGALVVDVNSQPGWRGLQSVTSVKIADEILDLALLEMRK
jgi:RimK family alpha-L-glutamate ligase